MRKLSTEEQKEFLTLHLEHRLTVILAFVIRIPDTAFWQGNGDLYRSALEGASTMLRVMIEFLGFRSVRKNGKLELGYYQPQSDDVTLQSFGRDKLDRKVFGDKADLIARVHEGIKKGTVHLTWESGHEYQSDKDFLPAAELVIKLLNKHLYEPAKCAMPFHPDLHLKIASRRQKSET